MNEPKNYPPDQHKQVSEEQSSSVTQSTSSTHQKTDQTNHYLAQLVHHTQDLARSVEKQQQNLARRQRSSRIFLRKMATEVPPVVLAVLLAFGINSWWQQRNDRQLAAQSLSNIVTESRANFLIYERIIQQDQRNLQRLKRQIEEVIAGIIHLDTLHQIGYGQGINLFTLSEGAWQAATLTGGIEHFDPNLVQDASKMYSKIHFRNMEHAGFEFNDYERYQEETLLGFLLENRDILTDHINNCASDMNLVRSFLEKYDPTFKSQ